MDVSRSAAMGLPSAPATPYAAALGRTSMKGEPQDVAAAILFREVLKPLAHGLGPVGEIALGAVADELFTRRPR